MKQLIVLLLLSASAFAQAGAYAGSPVINGVGQPIASASVAISTLNPCGTAPTYTGCNGQAQGIYTGATPPANLAALFTDVTGAHSGPNPVLTDPLGNWTAYALPGFYWATVYGYQIVPQVQIIVIGSVGVQASPIVLANCTAAGTTLNEGVNLSTQVIAGVPTLCGTTATANSTAVVGICASACGNSGSASIAYSGYQSCILDNQSTQNDYVVPSSNPGQCHDIGASTSSANETLGIAASTNTGAGTLATILLAPLSLILPGSTGGSGTVGASGCANGVAYYPGIGTVIGADCSFTTDGAGNWTAKSGQFVDASHSGFWFQVAGPALPAIASIPIHSFAFSVNPSFGTSYGLEPWDNAPVNGNCISAVTGDATNYFKLHDTGAPCGTGSGVTLQTNGAPNTSQALLNFANTPTITPSNPSGGVEQFSLAGSTQISTPSAPVLTTNGSAGVISYTYGVVGCEDAACAYHTALSATATIATGNATLTSSNSINLKTYGDTLYRVRGFLICRTASAGTPATVGVITNSLLAGKQFIDTGLAGDGTNCASVYASNTTTLQQVCLGSALPGVASPPGVPCGVDAPPATPTARDDENTETFGAPGDVNNPFWTWGNQQSATASWSNGTLMFTTDTLAQAEYLVLNVALPGTPFTFHSFFSLLANSPNQAGQDCFIGLRESSTGKITTIGISHTGVDTSTSSQGNIWIARNWTSNSATSAIYYSNYTPQSAYVKLTDDGTNLNYLFSNPEDGVQYHQYKTQTVITPFTTAPNQMIIGAAALGGVPVSCTFDFTRWP